MQTYEDVDLRVLKNISSDLRSANDFSNYYGTSFLSDDVKFFADLVIDHVKVYKAVPTPRVLIDKVSDNEELYANTREVLSYLKNIEAQPSEFSYDVQKIKNRFVGERETQIRADTLAGKDLSLLRRQIDEVENIKLGKRRDFTQKSLRSYVKDFKRNYNLKLNNPEYGRGIMSGYSCLDYVSNGLGFQELVIIGGDTGSGKSQFLNNLAKQIWLQKNIGKLDNYGLGYNILYFSLEMPFEPCFRRTFASLADVPSRSIRDAKLKKNEFTTANKILDFIEAYPYEFEIIDTPRGTSVETIEERYLDARDRFEPHVVVVDYLGLLEDQSADSSDWLKLGQLAGKLHEFARYYNVLVLTAVQLNRVQSKSTKESSDTVGLHRIGRSSLIMHHANVGIQIETRKDEMNYSDFIYHIIKMRDGESGVKHALIKNFANGSLKEPEIPYEPTIGASAGFEEWSSSEDMSALLQKYGWNC